MFGRFSLPVSLPIGGFQVANRSWLAFDQGYYIHGRNGLGEKPRWVRIREPFAISSSREDIDSEGLTPAQIKLHIKRLRSDTGIPFRLPKEREWERATRSLDNLHELISGKFGDKWEYGFMDDEKPIHAVYRWALPWLRKYTWINFFNRDHVGNRIEAYEDEYLTLERTLERKGEHDAFGPSWRFFRSSLLGGALYGYRYAIQPINDQPVEDAQNFQDLQFGLWECVKSPLLKYDGLWPRAMVLRRFVQQSENQQGENPISEERRPAKGDLLPSPMGFRLALPHSYIRNLLT